MFRNGPNPRPVQVAAFATVQWGREHPGHGLQLESADLAGRMLGEEWQQLVYSAGSDEGQTSSPGIA